MKQLLLFGGEEDAVPSVGLTLDTASVLGIGIDYLGSWIQKQTLGPNYRGLCPFHTERTPSFWLSAKYNSWKCYGCGISGGPLLLPITLTRTDTHPEYFQKVKDQLPHAVDYFRYRFNINRKSDHDRAYVKEILTRETRRLDHFVEEILDWWFVKRG